MPPSPYRKIVFGLAALGFLATGPEAIGKTSSHPVAKVASGQLQGEADSGGTRFLGIPYAAPPVGPLRWKPPQPALAWHGVRDATHLGAKCFQSTTPPQSHNVGSEDCLFLNVYAPAGARANLPVLVWFHGGGWVVGSSQDVDGRLLASKGVIVVTVNYRLGALGFYASPALDAESPDHVSGNLFLRDQQAALRWVRDNIHAFGGDPSRVTLAGESAGAYSNWIHVTSPASRNLFRGMIAESPVESLHPEAGIDDGRGVGGTRTLKDEEATGTSAGFASALGCAAGEGQLACLRAKSPAEIFAAMRPGAPGYGVGWTPVADGQLLPAPVNELLRAGRYKRVPILTGSNWAENGFGTLMKLSMGMPLLSAEQYQALTLKLPHGDELLARYPATGFASPEDAFNVMRGDGRICANLDTATTLSAFGPIYVYEFEDPNPPPTLFDVKVPAGVRTYSFHTSEITYVFQSGYPNEARPGPPPFTADQAALSARMASEWATFVKTGRPSASSGWKPFVKGGAFHLFSPSGDAELSEEKLTAQHNCGLWSKLWGG